MRQKKTKKKKIDITIYYNYELQKKRIESRKLSLRKNQIENESKKEKVD